MKLALFWKKNGTIFNLGVLEKNNNQYIFKINQDELKLAIKQGCVGIGNFDLLKEEYVSDNLFSFFKNRIPDENNLNINEILNEFDMNEYDEMKLLKYTAGELQTDNYYVEEVL